MEEDLVIVREYRTPWEARVAAARLEADGIACSVEDEDAATVFGSAVDFVKLKVPASQSGRAEEILLEIEEEAADDEDQER